ncbi:MAG: L-rhamnose isomerase [Oscillospiraceae bacterium]|nr:L-rhamnose isomerase [Oscillospiraceae bacterium]
MYKFAKNKYANSGIDTEKAIETLSHIPISLHCWQGDDVTGFENAGATLSGGIQATGNYPGKARTPDELMSDFDEAFSLIPGKKRINLHASYAIKSSGADGAGIDRDSYKPYHFEPWIGYAKKNGYGFDFNPTFFSHKLASGGMTLSSPDENIRRFWIAHAKACRAISEYAAQELNDHVLCNIWIPDGLKDIPADRFSPRERLADSLDKIFAEKRAGVIDSLESKVFGIGLESYTVGSSEFYIGYAASHKDVYVLLDNGHYHPTESTSDKISSLLQFFKYVPLHVTRHVRWDSDHVVLFDDEIRDIAAEIVRCGAVDRVLIGLDFFDASINRIAAWVIGARAMQKALLSALLTPHERMKKLQDEGAFTEKLMLGEEIKTYPFSAVWDEYCSRQNVPAGEEWFDKVKKYEKDVLSLR